MKRIALTNIADAIFPSVGLKLLECIQHGLVPKTKEGGLKSILICQSVPDHEGWVNQVAKWLCFL
jgi:hypothetical protein